MYGSEQNPKSRFVDSAHDITLEGVWSHCHSVFNTIDHLWTLLKDFAFVDGPAGTMFWNSSHSRECIWRFATALLLAQNNADS